MTTPSLLTPASATPTNLAAVQLGTGYAAVVTAGTNNAVKIGAASICNTDNVAVTVSIGILPNGDSPSDAYDVIHAYSLDAGDSLPLAPWLAGQYLAEGDSVIALASVAGVVNFNATGVTYA